MRTLQFIHPIGAGAVGTVYLAELATDRGFRRQVAVKVLQADRPGAEIFLSRMRDEARLLGLLQDDAILKVLDMVQVDGLDAVVMEYVEGIDLEAIAEAGYPPSPRALAEVGAAVAGALARAHGAVHPTTGEPLGVVHRDVKPANVMVTASGGVKLLDFGVARARFEARESFTGQLVLGTLNYMAPEYIVTGEISPAADVFGLALSLWQLAAGQVYGQPKVRKDSHDTRLAERLEQIRDTHAELIPALQAMLRWEPDQRPTASQVETMLLQASDSLQGTGLRTWARSSIPEVLQRRGIAADTEGLVGRTIELSPEDDTSGPFHAAATMLADPQDFDEPEPPPIAPVSLPVTAAAPVVTRTPTPARPASPPPSGPSLLVVILQGLVVGIVGALILVIAVIAAILLL